MTDEQCEKQIEAIARVTVEFTKSKAAARQYLKDAGIILEERKESVKRNITTKNKSK